MTSAREWERRVRRLAQHTPQDPAVLEALRRAADETGAGDLAVARLEGHLPYGAAGCDEDVEHRATLLWVAREGLARWPALRWLHHSPNEAAYRGQEGKGVVRGVPDLMLYWPAGGFVGLVLELKGPGGRLAPAQRQWLDHLAAQGWCVAVPYGFEAARAQLISYLSESEAQ